MSIQACLGGWCRKREHCLNYHAGNRESPRERICTPGHDGYSEEFRIVFHRPPGTWELARLIEEAEANAS